MRIVVGGLARKTGKTSLVCRIISLTRERHWIAVKVSHHPPDGGAVYSLVEELSPGETGDTSRFLLAGARRAFWLRGNLEAALPELKSMLAGAANWIVESGAAIRCLEHDYALLVVQPENVDDSKLLELLRGGEAE